MFLAAGIGYTLYVHEGYTRGHREYKDQDDEYTVSVNVDDGEYENGPHEPEAPESCRTDLDETVGMMGYRMFWVRFAVFLTAMRASGIIST